MGHTAIAEIQFADYIFPAFDQVIFARLLKAVTIVTPLLPACQRGRQVSLSLWWAVQCRRSNCSYAIYVRGPRWSVSLPKPRRLFHGRIWTQGTNSFIRFPHILSTHGRLWYRVHPFKPKDCFLAPSVIPTKSYSWSPRSYIALQVFELPTRILFSSHSYPLSGTSAHRRFRASPRTRGNSHPRIRLDTVDVGYIRLSL
jgi:hypothetical protein